ncbi:acetyltransferase [Gemmatirosa kalamazoonensis]|uniref:Acetyltransferase n=1 Tax=Gemmatirosa kalamazoonensis TaxID=861299 RepID=W0RPI3_9BACT|nr:acyltransferase [Gemmatirosa kalamazoonensis]AHG91398.1 acetyltransferase [Gemmatirosa kalamazoonensis]
MALLPLRSLPARGSASLADAWLESIADRLRDDDAQTPDARSELCRTTLAQLLYPTYAADVDGAVHDERLPVATRLALSALDPRNVTLEPEYYGECDDVKFQRVKPLLWLWYSFDRSPLGGQYVDLGVRLRRILAPHIFRRCGANFKCFQHVEFSFGYNMEVGDDVVVHRHVLLDDRGGIVLGNKVSISDYANVYSHTHSIVDQKDVTNVTTVLGDGVRVTYHATILAGVHVGEQGMVGAMAVATKDVRPYHVNVGIPAKSITVKPNAPPQELRVSPAAREKAQQQG